MNAAFAWELRVIRPCEERGATDGRVGDRTVGALVEARLAARGVTEVRRVVVVRLGARAVVRFVAVREAALVCAATVRPVLVV